MNAPGHWCYFEIVRLFGAGAGDLGKSEYKFHQREDMNAPAGVGVSLVLLWRYFAVTLVFL